MKVPVNRRVSLRRRQRRNSPKPRIILARLRMRLDRSMVMDLPGLVKQSLGKGVGGRVWFYAEGKGLHITGSPWGLTQVGMEARESERPMFPSGAAKGVVWILPPSAIAGRAGKASRTWNGRQRSAQASSSNSAVWSISLPGLQFRARAILRIMTRLGRCSPRSILPM